MNKKDLTRKIVRDILNHKAKIQKYGEQIANRVSNLGLDLYVQTKICTQLFLEETSLYNKAPCELYYHIAYDIIKREASKKIKELLEEKQQTLF